MKRCHWVNENNPLYVKYHDEEWCKPSHEDNFNYHKIANYNENKIKELLENTGIIRNKLKIAASINNVKVKYL